MSNPRRRRSLTSRVLASGVLQALAPDAAIAVALILIGVSLYRLSPNLVFAYAGLVVLVPALVVARAKADAKPDRKVD